MPPASETSNDLAELRVKIFDTLRDLQEHIVSAKWGTLGALFAPQIRHNGDEYSRENFVAKLREDEKGLLFGHLGTPGDIAAVDESHRLALQRVIVHSTYEHPIAAGHVPDPEKVLQVMEMHLFHFSSDCIQIESMTILVDHLAILEGHEHCPLAHPLPKPAEPLMNAEEMASFYRKYLSDLQSSFVDYEPSRPPEECAQHWLQQYFHDPLELQGLATISLKGFIDLFYQIPEQIENQVIVCDVEQQMIGSRTYLKGTMVAPWLGRERNTKQTIIFHALYVLRSGKVAKLWAAHA